MTYQVSISYYDNDNSLIVSINLCRSDLADKDSYPLAYLIRDAIDYVRQCFPRQAVKVQLIASRFCRYPEIGSDSQLIIWFSRDSFSL